MSDKPKPTTSATPPKAAAIATTQEAPTPPKRYRVLAAGLTGVSGWGHYRGDVLAADEIGDRARVQKLLDKRAIEEAT